MTDTHETILAPKTETPLTRRELHPALAEALRGGNITPEMLGQYLDVQERWESKIARQEFIAAMIALKEDLPPVLAHDKSVEYNGKEKYRHTSLARAVDEVTPHLSRHGFAVTFRTDCGQKGIEVWCRLSHRGGHHEDSYLCSAADTSGGKNAVQAVGSTTTYLRRYTLLALLGIATADMVEPRADDEANAGGTGVVDAKRNLHAAADIVKRGRKVADAEAFVSRSVAEWTLADLDRLRAWVVGESPPPASPEHEIESGPASEGESSVPNLTDRQSNQGGEDPGRSGHSPRSADSPEWWTPKAWSRNAACITAEGATKLRAACARAEIGALDLAAWLARRAGRAAPADVSKLTRSTLAEIEASIAKIDTGEIEWRKAEHGWDFMPMEGPTS